MRNEIEKLELQHYALYGKLPAKYVGMEDDDDLYYEILYRSLFIDFVPMTVKYIKDFLNKSDEEKYPEGKFQILY